MNNCETLWMDKVIEWLEGQMELAIDREDDLEAMNIGMLIDKLREDREISKRRG